MFRRAAADAQPHSVCNYYTDLTSVLQASQLEIWGGIQAEASDTNIICRTALQS